MRRRNHLESYISWFAVVFVRVVSSLPSPTRRMRWEGSKGMVGAGGVQVRAAEDGREIGGGPRFSENFFFRLAIVPQRVKPLSNCLPPLFTVHSAYVYVCRVGVVALSGVAASGYIHSMYDSDYGEIFGRCFFRQLL